MKSQHSVVLLILGIGFSIMPFTPIVRADHLELRNGQILQGKFLGGSPLNIRFQVDGQNLTNILDVIDFNGLFSGNAIGPSRSFALRLATNF